MSSGLNKIRKSLDIIFDKQQTEMTITEWKLFAGALYGVAEIIEDNGYYPNITQRELMITWLKRYIDMENKRIHG